MAWCNLPYGGMDAGEVFPGKEDKAGLSIDSCSQMDQGGGGSQVSFLSIDSEPVVLEGSNHDLEVQVCLVMG